MLKPSINGKILFALPAGWYAQFEGCGIIDSKLVFLSINWSAFFLRGLHLAYLWQTKQTED
jgi:hypothetical protein